MIKPRTSDLRHRVGQIAVTGMLLAAMSAVQAAPMEWGTDVGAGVAYSDNVNRDLSGTDAVLASVDGRAQLLKVTRSFMFDGEIAGAYRYFFDDQYEPELLGQARLDSSWTPVPEYFMWILNDNFGQVADSADAAASSLLPSPDRQNMNVFSTGPVAAIPLPWESRLELSGLYSDVYYQTTDYFENTRTSARAALEHDFSRRQSAYVGATVGRRDYKAESYVDPISGTPLQLVDFDLAAVTVGMQSATNRSNIAIEVGLEELRSEGVEPTRGEYIDIDIERQLSARSSMYLRYVDRFGDSADIFALDQTLEPDLGDTSNVRLTGDPIKQRRAGLGYEWEGARTNTHAGLSWSTEDLVPLTAQAVPIPNREIYGVLLEMSHRLSQRTLLGASAYYLRELRSDDTSQDDVTASVDLTVHLTSVLALRGQIEHYARLNSTAGDDYKENRVFISLRYIPRSVRQDLPSFVERRIGSRRGLEPAAPPGTESQPASDRARPRPPTP